MWTEDELDDLLADAVNSLYPRVARTMAEPIFPLDPDTEDYALPTGMRSVSDVHQATVADDLLVRRLGLGTWELYGDYDDDTLRLLVNRQYCDADHYLVLYGYGVWDLDTNYPPDQHVPLILAIARAEAYRRSAGDRVKFANWQVRAQKQGVSTNELLGYVTEAERERERLERRSMTWRRPLPARSGA